MQKKLAEAVARYVCAEAVFNVIKEEYWRTGVGYLYFIAEQGECQRAWLDMRQAEENAKEARAPD